tara:strand:+ start:5498 stop:5698 length:201 start_codon:yes stop_codon:yes gene_type:complete
MISSYYYENPRCKKMNKLKIFSLIKTDCGRAKYEILSSKKGILNRIRLYWFILFATIEDWNLKTDD